MTKAKRIPSCVRCGKEVPRKRYNWFEEEVHFPEPPPTEPKVLVIFKVEVRAPRHGRLCLKCLGEAITTSSSSMFGRLVELNAMVRDLVKQPVAPAPAPAPAWKPIS